MPRILVLIGDPARTPLPAPPLERLARRIGGRLRWLAPGEAVEVVVDVGQDAAAVHDLAGEALAGIPHDRALLPLGHRDKRLLVSDMDSTMITVECIDELADFVGCKAEVAAITRRAMDGELDFRGALIERVALLAGLEARVLDEVWRTRIGLMPGAAVLLRTMRARGARSVLVSGGFLWFVERVGAALGFDRVLGNRLEIRDGRLTGRVLEPIRDAADKLRVLRDERATLGLPAAATLAIGDGANDLPMLREAGLGVGFRGRPALAAGADVLINVGDLTAVLYLQGIARADFAPPGSVSPRRS